MSSSAVLHEQPYPGRICPADYCYSPAEFARDADFAADTLYVVGGLYGNLAALDEIERLAAHERTAVTIVFNGDFHWFDAEPEWFAAVERKVARHRALRGNVETEVARETDIGVGCGCAYPDAVGEDVVQRSNAILSTLRSIASPETRRRLRALPMHALAQVGKLRVAIVHGDAASLAGWRFAQDALDRPRSCKWLSNVHAASRVDIFASTHTCLATLRSFQLPGGSLSIINNGAAGMPNFSGTRFGLISRIAATPSPHKPIYGTRHGDIHIDAVPVEYDHDAFIARFLSRWPTASPAHASYYGRIVDGPDYSIPQAAP